MIDQLLSIFTKKKEYASAQSGTSSVRHSHCKVVLGNRNSIPDTDHPAGWVNRTNERKDAALKGQDRHLEACSRLYNLGPYTIT